MFLLMFALAFNPIQECSGCAYLESSDCIYLAGKYAPGSDEWHDKNNEWLNSDDNTPYPEDLTEVDGHGYNDSKNAAEDVGTA